MKTTIILFTIYSILVFLCGFTVARMDRFDIERDAYQKGRYDAITTTTDLVFRQPILLDGPVEF